MSARAIWLTGREGKGLMSTSEPVAASRSSCQPGKVASKRKVMKARMMATILSLAVQSEVYPREVPDKMRRLT